MCFSVLACLALAASSQANVYGYKEMSCMDGKRVIPCEKGAITASGEEFDPELPTFAVWMPRKMRVRPQWVWVRLEQGTCTQLWLNDKKGKQGFDLTPGALKALGVKPRSTWSGHLKLC